jgi:hypothetical protein
LSSVSLQATDVPGFSPVNADDETLTDPHDQGDDQAFIQCARSKPLLDQFDSGPDAYVSPFYGKGQNPFGTAKYSVASIVFGDGSVAPAGTAYAVLASPGFQHCWASTTDQLDDEQGITPTTSRVHVATAPHLGAAAAAYVWDVAGSALGQSFTAQEGFTIIRQGAVVALVVTITFGGTFPAATLTHALSGVSSRMGGLGAPTRASGRLTLLMKPTFGTPVSGAVAELAGIGAPKGTTLKQLAASVAWGDGGTATAHLSGSVRDIVVSVAHPHTFWSMNPVALGVNITDKTARFTDDLTATMAVSSVYLAMGDSYSSGEGANDYTMLPGCDYYTYDDPDVAPGFPRDTDHLVGAYTAGDGTCIHVGTQQGDICHRSITAYPHVLSRLLLTLVPDMKLEVDACSGATVSSAYAVPANDSTHKREKPQLVALTPQTSLVTLSFGGDDLDFSDLVINCVNPLDGVGIGPQGSQLFTCIKPETTDLPILGYAYAPGQSSDAAFDDDAIQYHLPVRAAGSLNLDALDDINNRAGTNLHSRLVLLLHAIRYLAPGARILVMGYPRWFPASGTSIPQQHFTTFEQRWVNDRETVLNGVIEDAVNESGVAEYVDIYNVLAGHEYDATSDLPGAVSLDDPQWHYSNGDLTDCSGSYMNPVDLITGKLGAKGAFHPDPCAHALIAKDFKTELASPSVKPLESFSLPSGENETVPFSIAPGTPRFTVTASWYGGQAIASLVPASGYSLASITNTEENPKAFYTQAGPGEANYRTYTWMNPLPGTWKVIVTNKGPQGTGRIEGSVTLYPDVAPVLPQTGTITIAKTSDGFLGASCTAWFKADNTHDSSDIKQYDWYDDNGNEQGDVSGTKDDVMQMTASTLTSPATFNMVLQTIAKDSEDRYLLYSVTMDDCNASTARVKQL